MISLNNVMGIIRRWKNSIISLRLGFLEILHKNIWVSWGVLFKGLGVQKGTQTPCWLRPWLTTSLLPPERPVTALACEQLGTAAAAAEMFTLDGVHISMLVVLAIFWVGLYSHFGSERWFTDGLLQRRGMLPTEYLISQSYLMITLELVNTTYHHRFIPFFWTCKCHRYHLFADPKVQVIHGHFVLSVIGWLIEQEAQWSVSGQ